MVPFWFREGKARGLRRDTGRARPVTNARTLLTAVAARVRRHVTPRTASSWRIGTSKNQWHGAPEKPWQRAAHGCSASRTASRAATAPSSNRPRTRPTPEGAPVDRAPGADRAHDAKHGRRHGIVSRVAFLFRRVFENLGWRRVGVAACDIGRKTRGSLGQEVRIRGARAKVYVPGDECFRERVALSVPPFCPPYRSCGQLIHGGVRVAAR